jgi:uncharacterized membrane protein YGL010W
MRKIDSLLEEYGESHQNRSNKLIHWIAVPVIVWTVIALLWSLPFPFDSGLAAVPLNWATLALLLAQVYWFRLSLRLGLGLLLCNVFLVQFTANHRAAAVALGAGSVRGGLDPAVHRPRD